MDTNKPVPVVVRESKKRLGLGLVFQRYIILDKKIAYKKYIVYFQQKTKIFIFAYVYQTYHFIYKYMHKPN